MVPLSRLKGAGPAKAAMAFRSSVPSWEISEQGACGGVADAGHGCEQLLLVPPDRGPADVVTEIGFDLGELPLQVYQMLFELRLQAGAAQQAQPIALGHHHLDDLAATGDEFGQLQRLGVEQRPGLGLHRLGEVGDRG